MKHAVLIGAALVILVFLAVVAVRIRRRPRLTGDDFNQRWSELQKFCASRKTWPNAVIAADDLLCQALKAKKFKGKTTGERLVAAQHILTSNDTIWFAHKYRNRIGDEDVRKLKKQEVLRALSGFRQALRDLGALK